MPEIIAPSSNPTPGTYPAFFSGAEIVVVAVNEALGLDQRRLPPADRNALVDLTAEARAAALAARAAALPVVSVTEQWRADP